MGSPLVRSTRPCPEVSALHPPCRQVPFMCGATTTAFTCPPDSLVYHTWKSHPRVPRQSINIHTSVLAATNYSSLHRHEAQRQNPAQAEPVAAGEQTPRMEPLLQENSQVAKPSLLRAVWPGAGTHTGLQKRFRKSWVQDLPAECRRVQRSRSERDSGDRRRRQVQGPTTIWVLFVF